MEQPRRPKLLVGLALLILSGSALAVWAWGRSSRPSGALPDVTAIPTPESRVTVEVLNATTRPGLAREGTRLLRRGGFDVVYFGTGDTTLDSTVIYVRRGSTEPAQRAIQVLGGGKVIVLPDPARRVDLTIQLGRNFFPPKDYQP